MDLERTEEVSGLWQQYPGDWSEVAAQECSKSDLEAVCIHLSAAALRAGYSLKDV